MGTRAWMEWPVYRQLTGADRLGRGEAVASRQTRQLRPRTATAEAGRVSARDPKYTIVPQKERISGRGSASAGTSGD